MSGFDAHKRVKGRTRHLLVDILGIPLSYSVTPADMHDTQGARRLLAGLKYVVPRLKIIWADSAYHGKELAGWRKAAGDWDLAVSSVHVARADSPYDRKDGSWNELLAGSRAIGA